jgi:hypothetical protein
MRIHLPVAIALLLTTFATAQTPQQGGKAAPAAATWTTLLDGTSLTGWNVIGNANWKAVNGAVEATSGTGFLVTPKSYSNFELTAEVWVDAPTANSGIFIRCSDPMTINQGNAYEINVYDSRPDQTGATGAIVDFAPPLVATKAAGKWNTVEIRADGTRLTVTVNGVKTAETTNNKYASGPVGLQYAAGTVRFRNVKIRTL